MRSCLETVSRSPCGTTLISVLSAHMAAIAKKLEENEDTGEQRYNYIRSGPDHFSMAFTYNVVAWELDDPTFMIFGMVDPWLEDFLAS